MVQRVGGIALICCVIVAVSALTACGPFGATATTAVPVSTAPPTIMLAATSPPTAMPTPATPAASIAAPPPPTVLATPSAPATNTAVAQATASPSPTAPATPALVTPTTPAPATARAAPPAPAAPTAALPTVGADMVVTEAQGRCTTTLPPGFASDPLTPDTYSGFASRVRVTLTALAAEPEDTLDDLALPFVGTFAGTVAEYRQTAVSKGAESLRVDFTGRLGSAGQGTLYVRQFATTTCALTFFAPPDPDLPYESLLTQIIATLRAVRAVG